MSLVALAALVAAPTPPAAPPSLSFGLIRMDVFQHRAHELHCASGELDRDLEQIVHRLRERYGKAAFPTHKVPPGGPGQCGAVLSVYSGNLADFRRYAEAALATAAPAPKPAE
jgi:hypothetical protein